MKTMTRLKACSLTRRTAPKLFSWWRFLPLAVLPALTGCRIWTGGIPPSWRTAEKYPVVASIHGIQKVEWGKDLGNIVFSWSPTNEIVLDPKTVHGWVIEITPPDKPLHGIELYVLPAPAKWPGRYPWGKAGLVSLDKSSCVRSFTIPKGEKHFGGSWGMSPDDPVGEYEIGIMIEDKLAADFRFTVLPNPLLPPVKRPAPAPEKGALRPGSSQGR